MKTRDDFKTELGRRIREVRKARNVNQGLLAEMTGLCRDSVSRYERGLLCPSAEAVASIALALGVSADHLLFGLSKCWEEQKTG